MYDHRWWTVAYVWWTAVVVGACSVRNDVSKATFDTSWKQESDSGDSDSARRDSAMTIELGPAIAMDCSQCPKTGKDPDALLCAIDLCDTDVVRDNRIGSPQPMGAGCELEDMYAAISHFGDETNDLRPRHNGSYAILATGAAEAKAIHSDPCTPLYVDPLAGFDSTDTSGGTDSNSDTATAQDSGDSATDSGDTGTAQDIAWSPQSFADPFEPVHDMFDIVEWKLTLTAPQEARGFSIQYIFFSTEYDEWISSEFNDKFYIVLNAPITTGGRDQVINYTDCRSPEVYFDFAGSRCDTPSGFCCYIAINSALSECCWYPANSPFASPKDQLSPPCPGDPVTDNTNISGTGFSCAPDACTEVACGMGNFSLKQEGTSHGSTTGWLLTAWPIAGGETFTLTFHIHDTSDALYDSAVILDAFAFHTELSSSGTVPVIIE